MTESELIEGLALAEAAIFAQQAIATAKLNADSRLVKSITAKLDKTELSIMANEYVEWVESGRKSVGEKSDIKKVPISVLLIWLMRYNIKPRPKQTRLSLAYAIQLTIYRNGIAPRPFTARAAEIADKFINPYLDRKAGEELDTLL